MFESKDFQYDYCDFFYCDSNCGLNWIIALHQESQCVNTWDNCAHLCLSTYELWVCVSVSVCLINNRLLVLRSPSLQLSEPEPLMYVLRIQTNLYRTEWRRLRSPTFFHHPIISLCWLFIFRVCACVIVSTQATATIHKSKCCHYPVETIHPQTVPLEAEKNSHGDLEGRLVRPDMTSFTQFVKRRKKET